MFKVFLMGLFLCCLIFPFFRMFICNLHNVGIYSVKDLYFYIKDRKWEDFNLYGIDLFIGMFGSGKTLTMTHRAIQIYNRYGDNVRFISNYHLNNIPYIPLINFKQLVDLGAMEDDDKIATVVLIDEISSILSHRNFANFPLELLSMLLQQRKRKIYIMSSAQRFFMCDKIWRGITTRVIDCKKIWRFANLKYYDAWDYEQAINSNILKPQLNKWYFVKDKDYNAYDTFEMISRSSAEDFISNEESIIRKGLESSISNPDNISLRKLNKSGRKIRKAVNHGK